MLTRGEGNSDICDVYHVISSSCNDNDIMNLITLYYHNQCTTYLTVWAYYTSVLTIQSLSYIITVGLYSLHISTDF